MLHREVAPSWLAVASSLPFGLNATEDTLLSAPPSVNVANGGFKGSGHGNDLSMMALEDYTRVKHVMTAVP